LDILRAIVLGVIQALTEFLPISSSAHLILFRDWIGLESIDGLTFDVALHVGTVAALIAYFRRDLWLLVRGFVSSFRRLDLRQDVDQRLAWYIVIATIPAGVAGLVFDDFIERELRTPQVIMVTLVAGSLLFIAVERFCKPRGGFDQVTFLAAFVIGLSQSFALVPGVSRSGITIAIGMLLSTRRADAARFSFLLSTPIMLAAGAKQAMTLGSRSFSAAEIYVFAAGALASALVGWLVIKYLLKFLQGHTLDVFAYYRFALAAVVFLWLA
jgi:undecaprenyl-diphosphatase